MGTLTYGASVFPMFDTDLVALQLATEAAFDERVVFTVELRGAHSVTALLFAPGTPIVMTFDSSDPTFEDSNLVDGITRRALAGERIEFDLFNDDDAALEGLTVLHYAGDRFVLSSDESDGEVYDKIEIALQAHPDEGGVLPLALAGGGHVLVRVSRGMEYAVTTL